MKALLLENIHPRATEVFGEAGIEVDTRPGALAEDELIEALQGVQLLGVRSGTQVTAPVVEGSDLKIDKEFRKELPELLWIYSMGIVLYWVHDSSPGCRKTYLLVERTVPLVNRMVSMSRLPGFKSVTRELVGIIREVRA